MALYLNDDQIQALRRGELTTCEARSRVDEIDPDIIPERLRSIGEKIDVLDQEGKSRARAKLIESFVTTFGKPDPRLAVDAERWKSDYARFWETAFPDEPLDDATELFVCRWAVL